MKIIFVIPSLSYRGGEKIFINLAEAVHKQGHKVVIIAGRKEPGKTVKIPPQIKFSYSKAFNLLANNNLFFLLFSWLFIFWEIKKEIKGTDWIICESNNCLYASALTNFLYKTKLAWYVMAYEEKHYKNRWADEAWNLTYGNIEKLAVARSKVIYSLAPRVQKAVQRRFDRSSKVLNPIIKMKKSYDVRNVRVDIKNFYRDKKILFLPAALHPKKNQQLAILTLDNLKNRHSDLNLVLAGSGAQQKYLQELVDNRDLQNRVMFTGVIAGDDIIYCYKNAFLTLICSISDNEGLSLTCLESLALGTPVLVSNQAGVATVISENRIGVVSRPAVEMFSQNISKVLSNRSKAIQVAQTGKKYVEKNYQEKNVAQQALSFLCG